MSLAYSREALEAVIGLLPEAVLLISSDGEVLSGNPRGARMLARPLEELRGARLEELVQEEREQVEGVLRVGSRSRELVPVRLTFIDGQGGTVPCRCGVGVLQPRTDENPAVLFLRLASGHGAAERFIALNMRIEELNREVLRRQRAEAAVIEQREWLRVTLASIGDAVIATDPSGRVAFMNAVAEALTGWSEAEAYGRHLEEVFVIENEETGARMKAPVTQVLRERKVVGLANQTVLVVRRGGMVPIEDSAAPIRDAEGRMHGVVLVFRDVTGRRALERERVEIDRRKDEFLAMLGHELRNPLAVLGNGIQVLRLAEASGAGPEGDGSFAEIGASMDRQIRHLARLVDDLLDVSRITTGKITLRREPTSLEPVIHGVVESLRGALDERSVDLHLALASEPLLVDGDAERLAQVFGNLLSNAVKFSSPGGRIWVSSGEDRGAAVVRVRDEGSGITAEMLHSIFDLFTQEDSTLVRTEGGLGVGLTVARLITEQHGGSIEARSEGPGRGSEFVVRLPLAERSFDSPPETSPSRPGGASRQILIVDDNADAADSLALLLTLAGHEVRTALDGPTALGLAEQHPPDVVLLDVGMPGMDGYEVARRLRQLSEMRDTTIVAITGYGGAVHRAHAAAAGFDHHLLKPVTLDALERLLDEA